MVSDILTYSWLCTLVGSKSGGEFLELGTGRGLSTAWILDGMDKNATLVSFDNDPNFLGVAKEYLDEDSRLELEETDGGAWVGNNLSRKFDYIFAATWQGKHLLLEEVLSMLNPGGLYIIEDMLPQDNWPDGHQ
jgi:predicted O-methyltransferase YrrM